MKPVGDLVQIGLPQSAVRLPDWLKVRMPAGENYFDLKRLMRGLGLHTVCESARCPNIGECWHHRTATFMILGELCTRRCGFCAVPKGKPAGEVDQAEPVRVAEAAAGMGLKYVVVTSVDRDDLADGGSTIFARTIAALRERIPSCQVEVLIPDFRGSDEALEIVLRARPDILNHNIETVPRLYPVARRGSRYERSLRLLRHSREIAPAIPTKSGLMVGLGETFDETCATLKDLALAGVGHRHHRPIPAPLRRAVAGDALLLTGRICLPQTIRRGRRNSPRRIRPARPQLLPRTRTNAEIESLNHQIIESLKIWLSGRGIIWPSSHLAIQDRLNSASRFYFFNDLMTR